MPQVIGQMWREVVGCRNWSVMRVPLFIALRTNDVESNQLIPREDSCWCMWSMLYWQGCHLEIFSATSSSCPKSQRTTSGAEMLMSSWLSSGCAMPQHQILPCYWCFPCVKDNGNYQVAFASTTTRTAQTCAKLQTSSNQSNEEEPVPQLTDRMKMKL